jgi:hypothetical protein
MRRRRLLSFTTAGLVGLAGCQGGDPPEPTLTDEDAPPSPTPPETPAERTDHQTGTLFDGEVTGGELVPANVVAGQRLSVTVPELSGDASLRVSVSHANLTYARYWFHAPDTRERTLMANRQRVAIRLVAHDGEGDPVTVPVELSLSEQEQPDTDGVRHDGTVRRRREWLVWSRQVERVRVTVDDLDAGEKAIAGWVTPDGDRDPRWHVYDPETFEREVSEQGFGFVRVEPLRTEAPLDASASATVRVVAEPRDG